MITTETVQVQYVNQPKKVGGKYGNIKDGQGRVFWVPAQHLGAFAPGATMDIGYDMQTWGQNNVAVVSQANGMPLGHSPQAGQAAQAIVQRVTPQMPDGQRLGQHDDSKEEGMFVMGVVGRAMGSGQFAVTDIELLTKAAVQAWRSRNQYTQAVDDEYRDFVQ